MSERLDIFRKASEGVFRMGMPGAIIVPKPPTPAKIFVPQGAYRSAASPRKIAELEVWQGRPVERSLDFQAVDNWSNQQFPSWQADAWKNSGRKLWLGATGTFPDSEGGYWDSVNNKWAPGTGWARAATGEFDVYWQNMFNRLVANGQADAWLRGAHEFNFQLHKYFVTPESTADFITAWRRYVEIGRATTGANFLFEWNPTIGYEYGFPLPDPATAWPGDAWVDRVAIDTYAPWFRPRAWLPTGTVAEGNYPPTEEELEWAWDWVMNDGSISNSPWYQSTVANRRGMNFWKDFCIAHNKKMSLPEWGLRNWDYPQRGTGDDWRFVERMHGLITGTTPGWEGIIEAHAFWEHSDSYTNWNGVMDPDDTRVVAVPASRESYLRLFGGDTTAVGTTKLLPVRAKTITETGFQSRWFHAYNADNYVIERRVTGTVDFAVVATITDPSFGYVHTGLVGGESYDVRITPRKGTTAAAPSNIVSTATDIPGKINDHDTGTVNGTVEYSAGWSTYTGSADDGSIRYSGTPGATYKIRFNGTGIAVYGVTEATGGELAWSVDGGPETFVSVYSATRIAKVKHFEVTGLLAGDHIVTVRVTGVIPAGSTNDIVTFDYAMVT